MLHSLWIDFSLQDTYTPARFTVDSRIRKNRPIDKVGLLLKNDYSANRTGVLIFILSYLTFG